MVVGAHMFMREGRSIGAVLGVVFALLLLPFAAIADDGANPIPGEASTEPREQEATGSVSVVDVRAGSHDGFDRVTFEVAGEGEVGWGIDYTDEPLAGESDLPLDMAGAVALRVVLLNTPIPGSEPEGVDNTFLDDVPGPLGGVVLEVVNDTVIGGGHSFYIGLEEELPFRVARLENPQRVVIDLVHAEVDEPEQPVPVGVDAGQGGAADGAPVGPLMLALGAAFLALGSRALWRRRPETHR